MSSIFRKIINGEIPCHKISENKNCFAFLDINPIKTAHTLVVPKLEVDRLFDLDDKILSELFIFSKKIAKAIEKIIPCNRVGVIVAGLEVSHAHVHLVPISKISDLDFSKAKRSTDRELSEVAERIRAELRYENTTDRSASTSSP